MFEAYLEETEYVNYSDENIRRLAAQLKNESADEAELIRKTYYYVRDGIRHSWDAQDHRVTVTAGDVLREGVGICWAKANLLAALLRANGIPSGFSYQRLTLGDTPDTGYCIHALNTVYVSSMAKWIRLDARGNKPGVQAAFSLDEEKLAFEIRSEGEIDYKDNHARPDEKLMDVLKQSTDAIEMYLHHLPDQLSRDATEGCGDSESHIDGGSIGQTTPQQDGAILIRSMKREDIDVFYNTYASYGWEPSRATFEGYYADQASGRRDVFIAEYDGETAGICTLVWQPEEGALSGAGIPEIVDLTVFYHLHRKGIGSKLLDAVEAAAAARSSAVYLAVGVHSGYGPAHRLYAKRGYIPDGSGVWYRGQPLAPYAPCVNDDELLLFLIKEF